MNSRFPVLMVSIVMIFCTHTAAQPLQWDRIFLLGSSPVSALHADDEGLILVSTEIDGHQSVDKGLTWQPSGPRHVNQFAVGPSSDIWAVGVEGIHTSIDGGAAWLERQGPVPVSDCYPYQVLWEMLRYTAITFVGETVAVGLVYEHGAGGCKLDSGILYSYDDGATWHRGSWGIQRLPRNLQVIGDSVYWGGDGGGVFRTGFPPSPGSTIEIVFPNTHMTNRVLIVSQDSLFVLGTGIDIMGRRRGQGIFIAVIGGETWQQVNTGLTDTTITALVAHTDGHLFAGTESGGVFRSTNNGDSWEPVNMGLDDLEITALAISDEGILYAGTKNGKVYRTEGTVVSSEPGAELPSAYRLGQNYPNPFNPSTTIPFTLPEAAHVTLTVYDLLGREVAVPVSGTLPAGEHTATFNAADVATGVYLYRLTAGGFTETRRMTVVR